MGLKGYKLWVMCQLDSTCRAPPPLRFITSPTNNPVMQRYELHVKAKFEKRGLHFIGLRPARRFQATGKLNSTCTAPP
jgi:hypothetical protein